MDFFGRAERRIEGGGRLEEHSSAQAQAQLAEREGGRTEQGGAREEAAAAAAADYRTHSFLLLPLRFREPPLCCC